MQLAETTVFEKIKEISGKHELPRMLGVDTLVLIMRTTVAMLMPILTELEQKGLIVLHASPNAGKGTPKLTDAGKVSLPLVEKLAEIEII